MEEKDIIEDDITKIGYVSKEKINLRHRNVL